MHGVTYKVGRIHDAILNRMSAVQGEFQDLLLLLPTLLLNHLLLLAEKCKGVLLNQARHRMSKMRPYTTRLKSDTPSFILSMK